MAGQIQLSKTEIDTKGVEIFNAYAAVGNPEECRKIAAFIMTYSTSEAVKRHVRNMFTSLLVQRYAQVFGFAPDDFDAERANLLNLYSGGNAHKKLNISTDIDVFSKLATKYVAENVTLLRYDRLYTLFQAVKNTLDVSGDIVELGVYRGGSCKFTRELIDILDGDKDIFGFDTFEGHASITEHDGGIQKQGKFRIGGVKEVEAYISDPRVKLIEGDVSQTFPAYAETSKGISFAHLDMDVYQPTADTLPFIFDLLSPRGIILMDDYGFKSCPGVKRSVDDFLETVIATSFHLMTGQMIIVK